MLQERLTGLALLNMHRNINLNVENATETLKREGGGNWILFYKQIYFTVVPPV